MDKYEYRIRADEIKTLIAQGAYQYAVEIADTIDWTRVKNIKMLCTVSDLYKINRRLEESRDILLLAYDRHPGSRPIVYSLCELSIKLEDIVRAVEYYKEYTNIAFQDAGKYILLYKIYEAQEVGIEERIDVLEEYKKKVYKEKWAYELAYLYHRMGLETKCVEECDELILWFGDGKYVIKAMELKKLHRSLTVEQEYKYKHWLEELNQTDTSLTKGYSMRKSSQEQGTSEAETYQNLPEEAVYESDDQINQPQEQENYLAEQVMEGAEPTNESSTFHPDEMDIQVRTMDVSQYNTINLQMELAAGLREVLQEENKDVFFGETGELAHLVEKYANEELNANLGETSNAYYGTMEENNGSDLQEIEENQSIYEEQEPEENQSIYEEQEPEENQNIFEEQEPEENQGIYDGQKKFENYNVIDEQEKDMHVEMNIHEHTPGASLDQPVQEKEVQDELPVYADVLSMESNGQISLVMPEFERVEKQITGQMSIEDILKEWERLKKENEEKRKEDVRQRVIQHTGAMFTEFEAAARDGLLEKLEQEKSKTELETSKTEQAISMAVSEDTYLDSDIPVDEIILAEIPIATSQELEDIVELDSDHLEDDYDEDTKLEENLIDNEIAEQSMIDEYQENYEDDYQEDYSEEFENDFTESLEERNQDNAGSLEEDAEYELEEGNSEDAEFDLEEGNSEDAVYELNENFAADLEYKSMEGNLENIEYEVEEDAAEDSENEFEKVQKIEKDESPEIKQAAAKSKLEKAPDKNTSIERDKPKVRTMTKEEKKLFNSFIHSRASSDKLVKALDTISMAAYTGNVVIAGEEGADTLTFAKNIIQDIKSIDRNLTGKVAKISASTINTKNAQEVVEKLKNGALIIQKASSLTDEKTKELYDSLQQEAYGIIVIMEDTKKAMRNFLSKHSFLKNCFNAQVEMETLNNTALVKFGKKYAREKEYSIDALGELALHTIIENKQTISHAVNIKEVQEIIDQAVAKANKKTFGHFLDIVLSKRYDEEDMIVLTENDFQIF